MGIDRTEWSPTLQRKIARAGTKNTSFAAGSDDLLDYLELQVDVKQVERVTERIGKERYAERDAAVERYLSLPLVERKDKPEGVPAPALAVVGVDGGRLQIRSDRTAAANASAGPATAATPAAGAEEALPPTDDKHRGTHWREDKIGLLMTMTSKEQACDPCPQVPAAFVDPTRIAKLARELKTKKSANVASGTPEVAAASDQPEQGDEVLRAHGRDATWKPPEVKDKHLTATRRPWAISPTSRNSAWTSIR